MSWDAGSSMDPRFERYRVSQTAWLNRWLLRHPVRGPVIGFVIGGIIIGLSFIPGMGKLAFLAIPPFLLATLLLIYALIRRLLGITFVEDEDFEEEPPPETYVEVDEQVRQQAVASWRQRARQDRH
ncbi:MAG: hypothetical protein JSV77_11570 [Dehalococcoidales bacterium]|nr:MAG: hypothetical protein JSV77_11570 [Dehalococcoidales bacterium]